ncbi:MAG: T9SS type A sorting domain-containing protein [Chitinophagaceae bacterium]
MKKSILLALLLVILTLSTRAQTKYHYYFDSTSVFKEYAGFGFNGFYATNSYYTHYFDGDSLIGSNWYYRQYEYRLDSIFDWNGFIDTLTRLQAMYFVREDSSHKIWLFNPAIGYDILQNDWGNMQAIGDTFQYSGNCVVAQVDSVYLGSMALKRVRPAYNNDSINFTRGDVEGVGRTGTVCGLGAHSVRFAVCFSKQGNSVLLSHRIPCNSFLAPVYTHHYGDSGAHPVIVSTLSPANSFKIYPNPATNEIRIERSEGGFCELQIFDVTGRKMLVRNCPDRVIRIDVSALPSGRYYLRLGNARMSEHGQFVKE